MKCRPAASESIVNASFVCKICFIFHTLLSVAYNCENSDIEEIDIPTYVLPYRFEPQAQTMPACLSNSSTDSGSYAESSVDETDGHRCRHLVSSGFAVHSSFYHCEVFDYRNREKCVTGVNVEDARRCSQR